MLPRMLGELLRGSIDLVFAPTCLSCRGIVPSSVSDRMVCSLCWSRARPIPHPRCPRCSTPLRLTGRDLPPKCGECPEIRPAVRAIRSAFLLEGPPRSLVHALKYHGWHRLAAPMAERMNRADWPPDVVREVRIVVPVPQSSLRKRQRGYNQALLLARAIAQQNDWQLDDGILRRTGASGSQTTLHPGERRANVSGDFALHPGAEHRLGGEHLLLVDDVWTTGATALACADVLLDAGARAISVLTFARALPALESHARRVERAASLTQDHGRR